MPRSTDKKPARRRRHAPEPAPADLVDAGARDFILARLAVTLAELKQAEAALEEMIAFFVAPEEDEDGDERDELGDAATEHLGNAECALEAALQAMESYDTEEGEPWAAGEAKK